jgi:photosystem II stability/assembly factor-like uncharacterized protein
MGGRIADLAVVESKPQVFYVGAATGGLWKTVNHGTTWEPLFDGQPTSSIGDVTIAPSNTNIVWVGTGEPQNRQSSPWGNGAYKSMDGGRTWAHMGLEDTKHIARIVIHPRNPDVVYVAAVGHLWGANADRGVFKTTDGGSTWSKVLFIDDDTGAIDLAMDPGDPNTLYAAMYQRRRTGWGFNGGGPGSGLYRTLDGGDTWIELTDGLPEGDKGRIGIDVYRRDGNVVYATIEADKRDPAAGFGGGQGGQGERDRKSGLYRSTNRGETWEWMSATNPRPMYYSQVRIDPNNPERIYVLGTRLSVSDDGGKTFRNDGAETIHVDHHALWINPNDSDHLILGSDGGVSASWDGTGSWRMFDNLAIGQFYQIGLDMRDPYYVCGGLQDNDSWCGPSRTLNIHGIRNQDWYEVWGGDGFYNVIDPTDHTIVFTESQGGNIGRYDVTTGEKVYLRPIPGPRADGDTSKQYRFNWNAPIIMSSHDPGVIYIGANHLMRSPDRGHTWEELGPDLTKQIDRKELEIMGVKGSEPMLSPNDGTSTYGNITTISESPFSPSVVYVGTDDGNVQVTLDGGASWENVADRIGVPERTYVSRLFASRHAEGRVYATFDGHRNDDYTPYAFVSDDYGRNWRPIANGLPDEWSVNVIVEHHRTPELLFLGNEVGAFFTVDGGDNWTRLGSNFPTVPVDDIQIHPRDNDLVLGTHGRSAWILHDVTPLENLSAATLASAAHLFPVQPVTMWSLQGDWPFNGATYAAPNPPLGARIRYVARGSSGEEQVATGGNGGNGASSPRSRASADTIATITILSAGGDTVRTLSAPTGNGVQEIIWDLRYDEPYDEPEGQGGGFFNSPNGPRVMPGTYTAALAAGGEIATTSIDVLPEPRRAIAETDRIVRREAVLSLYRLAGPLHEATEAARKLDERLSDIEDLLKENPETPAEVSEQLDSLKKDLEVLRDELGDRARDARVGRRIDGATAVPTADQQWQVEELWREVPGLIAQVNEMIEERLPALNRMLDELGIRPDAGKPIVVPKRR